jgi:hypothetical protein
MKWPRGVLDAGHVRRVLPTVIRVRPFPGSTGDDLIQLRWLARHYAQQVPWGLDWPLWVWARHIQWHVGDHAAVCWLQAYVRRQGAQGRAPPVTSLDDDVEPYAPSKH